MQSIRERMCRFTQWIKFIFPKSFSGSFCLEFRAFAQRYFLRLFTISTLGGTPDWGLTGKSYVWMFPIYGSAAIFLDYLMPYFRKFSFFIRLFFYPIGIFIVEYITGWILDMVTGKCPWEYHSPYAIHGYIHLAYTPFWMLFGIALEIIYNTLQKFKE